MINWTKDILSLFEDDNRVWVNRFTKVGEESRLSSVECKDKKRLLLLQGNNRVNYQRMKDKNDFFSKEYNVHWLFNFTDDEELNLVYVEDDDDFIYYVKNSDLGSNIIRLYDLNLTRKINKENHKIVIHRNVKMFIDIGDDGIYEIKDHVGKNYMKLRKHERMFFKDHIVIGAYYNGERYRAKKENKAPRICGKSERKFMKRVNSRIK